MSYNCQAPHDASSGSLRTLHRLVTVLCLSNEQGTSVSGHNCRRSPHLVAEGVHHHAAALQTLQQEHIGLVLTGAQQLKLALHIHLQAHLQRAQAPTQLSHLHGRQQVLRRTYRPIVEEGLWQAAALMSSNMQLRRP